MPSQPALDPAARIDRLLAQETAIWLSTVRPDGSPHLVPIWFSWDGHRLFVASKPNAVKVRNLRANSRVMLALGEPDEDFDVGLVEAVAELPKARTRDLLSAGHFEKYALQMTQIGLDAAEYCESYSQPILIEPIRFLPWHGRTKRRSGRPVERPRFITVEPVTRWARKLTFTLRSEGRSPGSKPEVRGLVPTTGRREASRTTGSKVQCRRFFQSARISRAAF
jgi:PPOX class probable F420-dependent enzyme